MEKKPLLARLLYRFTGNLRCRIINGNHGEPYLERYHLFRLPRGGGVYIHRFVDSDPDRGLHDHPWKSAASLILSGGYRELRIDKPNGEAKVVERRLGAGRLNLLQGEDFHRIVLDQQQPVWTLFAHTGKYKDWGFLTIDDDGQSQYNGHESVTHESEHFRWWQTAPRGKSSNRAQL